MADPVNYDGPTKGDQQAKQPDGGESGDLGPRVKRLEDRVAALEKKGSSEQQQNG